MKIEVLRLSIINLPISLMSSRDEQQRVYSEQVAQGKSHEYALAYASKLHEGEVFARHFALIRFAGLFMPHPTNRRTARDEPATRPISASPSPSRRLLRQCVDGVL